MTSSISSYMPFSFGAMGGTSQVSSDQALFDLFNTQQSQSNTTNPFDGMDSLSLSDAALSALGGSGNSADGILNTLGYSNYSNTSPDTSTPFEPIATNTLSFAQATEEDGGPLPAFLAEVDVQMHLSTTQQVALQNIASENMGVSDTPATIQTIAMELQQANI